MDENNDTLLILQKLSRYYREVLKYVSSSASRVLQNVAQGQRYGLTADLCLLVEKPDVLKKTVIKIKKPRKTINTQKFKEEEQEEKKQNVILDDDDEWGSVPAFLRRSKLK